MTPFKLGLNNVKHNFKNYVSYFVSTMASVFILMIFYSIYYNSKIQAFSSGRSKVSTVFKAASVIVIVFSAIFIFYANDFFIKNKKKEVALYSILGMKKKEIGALMFFENIFIGILALAAAIPLGAFTSRFFLRLLGVCIRSSSPIKYTLDIRAVLITIFIFMIIFILNSIKAYNIIYKFSLIELMDAAREGEKRPECSKPLALLSVILIIGAYIIALKMKLSGGSRMIYTGLLVVLLVIAGTYILFNNLIIYIFKLFQKNKRMYYKGENLVGISQIIYRIKGNSNMLATISIISAVAITALCFTFSFYMSLNSAAPEQCPFSLMYTSGNENLNKKVEAVISSHKENRITYKADIVMLNGNGLTQKYKGPFGRDLKAPFDMVVISESEYNDIMKISALKNYSENRVKSIKISKENQCFFIEQNNIANGRGRLKGDKLNAAIGDKSYSLDIADSDIKGVLGTSIQEATVVVSDSFFKQLVDINKDNMTVIRVYNFENQLKSAKIDSELSRIIPGYSFFNSYNGIYTMIYSIYGSYVFIGMFLGILFIASTGSILYYKQLTEGYEDRNRYSILSKVGVSKKETLIIIIKQLGFIFAMPLLFAVIDSTVALKIYINYWGSLGSKASLNYMTECIFGMMGIYIVIYLLYYLLSVKSYMKIVHPDK